MPPHARLPKRREKPNVTRLCKAQDRYAGEEGSDLLPSRERRNAQQYVGGPSIFCEFLIRQIPSQAPGPSHRPDGHRVLQNHCFGGEIRKQSLLWPGSWTQCHGRSANGRSEEGEGKKKRTRRSPSMSKKKPQWKKYTRMCRQIGVPHQENKQGLPSSHIVLFLNLIERAVWQVLRWSRQLGLVA